MPLGDPKEPVPGFPLRFQWLTGDWERIFDEQIRLIRADIQRARLDGKIIMYLSCPISARGGGHSGTNVEIARFTERRLLRELGERFWILNPAQYQLESKEGFGLFDIHAKTLRIDLAALLEKESPRGADYMRMWTKILVEDSLPSAALPVAKPQNLGTFFDAYYFLGPSDVRAFFGADSVSLSAGIEQYFSRKYTFDRSFHDTFTVGPANPTTDADKAKWDADRRAFLVYYALRASATVSLGSHDEWAIFTLLNQARRKLPEPVGGIPNQIAGFFDGHPLAMSTGEAPASLGYAVPT